MTFRPGTIPSMLNVFADRKMAIILLMSFSCGIPIALTGTTLQAWMKSRQIDLAAIGILSLASLPYSLKFLWSPLMDRFVPPFLGRRRGWMLIAQISLIAAIASMAMSQELTTWGIGLLALMTAFFSASQDIVADAYRTEILNDDELGAGAGIYITGYRIGMVVSGAISLILADHLPWRSVYLLMAAAMSVGIIATLAAPEPRLDGRPPRTFAQAVVLPLTEFLRRRGAAEILLFILIYKADVFTAQAMVTPFLKDIGFPMTDIGMAAQAFGLVSTIIGGLVGGALMVRLGMRRSLWTFGLLQGLSGLAFMLLATVGKNYAMLFVATVLENLCVGMGISAFVAFMMSLCDRRFTATQMALLTSLMGLSRVISGTFSGWLAKSVGWEMFFIAATVMAIPGLLLLLRFNRWTFPVHKC